MSIPVLAATAYLITYETQPFGTTRPAEGVEWYTDDTEARTRLANLTTRCDAITGHPTHSNIRLETVTR